METREHTAYAASFELQLRPETLKQRHPPPLEVQMFGQGRLVINGYVYKKLNNNNEKTLYWICIRNSRELSTRCSARAISSHIAEADETVVIRKGPKEIPHNHLPDPEEVEQAKNYKRKTRFSTRLALLRKQALKLVVSDGSIGFCETDMALTPNIEETSKTFNSSSNNDNHLPQGKEAKMVGETNAEGCTDFQTVIGFSVDSRGRLEINEELMTQTPKSIASPSPSLAPDSTVVQDEYFKSLNNLPSNNTAVSPLAPLVPTASEIRNIDEAKLHSTTFPTTPIAHGVNSSYMESLQSKKIPDPAAHTCMEKKKILSIKDTSELLASTIRNTCEMLSNGMVTAHDEVLLPTISSTRTDLVMSASSVVPVQNDININPDGLIPTAKEERVEDGKMLEIFTSTMATTLKTVQNLAEFLTKKKNKKKKKEKKDKRQREKVREQRNKVTRTTQPFIPSGVANSVKDEFPVIDLTEDDDVKIIINDGLANLSSEPTRSQMSSASSASLVMALEQSNLPNGLPVIHGPTTNGCVSEQSTLTIGLPVIHGPTPNGYVPMSQYMTHTGQNIFYRPVMMPYTYSASEAQQQNPNCNTQALFQNTWRNNNSLGADASQTATMDER